MANCPADYEHMHVTKSKPIMPRSSTGISILCRRLLLPSLGYAPTVTVNKPKMLWRRVLVNMTDLFKWQIYFSPVLCQKNTIKNTESRESAKKISEDSKRKPRCACYSRKWSGLTFIKSFVCGETERWDWISTAVFKSHAWMFWASPKTTSLLY